MEKKLKEIRKNQLKVKKLEIYSVFDLPNYTEKKYCFRIERMH